MIYKLQLVLIKIANLKLKSTKKIFKKKQKILKI